MLHSPVIARRLRSALLALTLMLGTSWPVLSADAPAETPAWKQHSQKATALVVANKYNESLDEFTAAYIDFKELHQQKSLPAITMYKEYRQALKLANMPEQEKKMAEALKALQPKIFRFTVEKNNEGVNALSASDFKYAVACLEQAIILDPTYERAKSNLAIAYNNHGLREVNKDKKSALKLFRKALLVDPSNEVTRNNLNLVLKMTGIDPKNHNSRVTAGDTLVKSGEPIDAYVEYREAIRLLNAPAVRAKLEAVPITDPILVALNVTDKKIETVTEKTSGKVETGNNVNFGPYMAQLEKTIKANWYPPKGNVSKSCQVLFKVNRQGVISSTRVLKSSGSALVDQAGLEAVKKAGKLPTLPLGAPADVDIAFTFDYNVFSGGKKLLDSNSGGSATSKDNYEDKFDIAVHSALETGSSKISDFIFKQAQKAAAQDTLKKASEDKNKAIVLIAQTDGIAPGDQVKESFENAVRALGKNPAAESDLLALSQEALQNGQYAAAVFVLDKAPAAKDEQYLQARRAAYAMYIADDLMKSEKTADGSPYGLSAKHENIASALKENYTLKEPDPEPGFPPVPKSIDLTAFVESPASDAAKKMEPAPLAFPGTDESLKSTQADATKELIKLSEQIDSENGKKEETRTKQAVLLIQFGNTLMAEKKFAPAAMKFRQALYLYPNCTAAQSKLDEALKSQNIDPSNAKARFELYKSIAESGQAEAAITELSQYARLADDGPSYALLGLLMLDDYCSGHAGYRYLLQSFEKPWPQGTNNLKASVHYAVAKLLERDAEEAKTASQKERLLSDIQKASIEYRIAATLDPKNQEILDGFLENAKTGVRYANNPNNNLMLGGAYYLKGQKDLAKGAYGLALTQNPRDPGIKDAYDKFKALTTR